MPEKYVTNTMNHWHNFMKGLLKEHSINRVVFTFKSISIQDTALIMLPFPLPLQQHVSNEENRRTPRTFSPTAYNGNSGYRDQVKFRYAPSAWSDTDSIDGGIGAMRINGVRPTLGSLLHDHATELC